MRFINKRFALLSFIPIFSGFSCQDSRKQIPTENKTPNIIFILLDDMGINDLGCYGQTVLKTPNIDRMAQEGIRFTQFYSGSPVCAPSRSTLMTGKHAGHTRVRDNKVKFFADELGTDRLPLLPEDVIIPEMLKQKGYVTGMFGKWGLGDPKSTGEPNDQGFDQWTGYLNQNDAHNHFTEWFWNNKDTLVLPGNANNGRLTHSNSIFTQRALDFITQNKDTSFFLFMPYTLPHDGYQMPEEEILPFKNENWPQNEKVYAAMINRIDTDAGRILDLLKNLDLDSNTMVFLCSDNGAARCWDNIKSCGDLKGKKRDLYEGGIRVPMIVRFPGKIPANSTSDLPCYFPDLMPTLAELTGTTLPDSLDGRSFLSNLYGKVTKNESRFMYWEFHEKGFVQAVRWNNWKAIRLEKSNPLELYDLSGDPAEENNVSEQNTGVIETIEKYLSTARTESKYWKTE